MLYSFVHLPQFGFTQSYAPLCENGGFESGFSNWLGYSTEYRGGGSSCSPTDKFGNPAIWTINNLPEFRRFEIVTTGLDSLVGIQKTKFGNSALKLNNRYGQDFFCGKDGDANKIVKKFTVTAENLNFNLWYAVVLEQPEGHIDAQSFFSIKCDLAPNSDLCIDASLLMCDHYYSDPNCMLSPIVVLDWNCHEIEIPANKIGQIATLEIIAADCAQGAHFGYAYIDGLCVSCEGSPFIVPTVDYVDDLGCKQDTIEICGSYDLSGLCGDDWVLDSIIIPGITNLILMDHPSVSEFCIDIPIANFTDTSCIFYKAIFYFSSPAMNLPAVYSNQFLICPNRYKPYSVFETIGDCKNNGTLDFLSDDYYYVNLDIIIGNKHWQIDRELDDPYPNESGKYKLKDGYGGTNIQLGPFLIQDGSWNLRFDIDGCIKNIHIVPPEYCSGCSSFHQFKISNITCDNMTTASSTDDTWSFDIQVPGSGNFYLNTIPITNCTYGNSFCNIQAGMINQGCLTFTLQDEIIPICNATFTICPPKPCSNNPECIIELFVQEIFCSTTNYSVNVLAIGGTNLCYKAFSKTTGLIISQGIFPLNGNIGPFTEDVYLSVYQCFQPECSKIIYIPYPNCENPGFGEGGSTRSLITNNIEVTVIPNPVNVNHLIIKSDLNITEFEIFNISGKQVLKNKFTGKETQISFDQISGLYILKYINKKGEIAFIKFMKL